MPTEVDAYFASSNRWVPEALRLREILLGAGLDEALKWGKPTYVLEGGGNIAIIQKFKDSIAVMFFRGALLTDPEGLLEFAGANSHTGKRAVFTSVAEIEAAEPKLGEFIEEAVKLYRAGLRIDKTPDWVMAEELRARLDSDAELKAAFEALTAGRQRAHNLMISGARKSETRRARVEKYVPAILQGKGPNER